MLTWRMLCRNDLTVRLAATFAIEHPCPGTGTGMPGEGEDVRPRYEAFLDRVNKEIAPLLPYEPNATVRSQFEELVAVAGELGKISLEPGLLNRLNGRLKSDRELAATKLADAFESDQDNYSGRPQGQ